MSRAKNIESPYAPGPEFGAEVETAETWAGARLPVVRNPRWYGIGVPQFADEARAVGGFAVPSGDLDYVPEPPEPVTDEDVERVEEFIAAATDMRYALLLRRGR